MPEPGPPNITTSGPRSATHRLLPELIEESFSSHSARPALVVGDGRTWTYGVLADAVDEASRALEGLGIRWGDVIVFRGDRGVDQVVTVLAAWRQGAAVAFTSPGANVRLDSLRRRVGPRLVVSGEETDSDIDLMVRLALSGNAASGPEVRRNRVYDQRALAYVLATSGSTGEPKHVAVPHAALAHRCGWAQQAYPLTPDDVVLASSSPSFDFSVWETFAPLAVGATVAIAPPGAQAEPDMLDAYMRENKVSVAHFVPSLLGDFLGGGGGAGLAELRLLLVGGEAFTGELGRRIRKHTSAAIWNQYGPTEGCIDVVAHEVRPNDLARDNVPIGRPLDGVTALVVDETGRSVEPGGTGELHVSGPLLAWGYLGMPGQTASRFVPSPHGEGGRVYRTGDLVRREPDDLLTYVCRTDDQVKIRGVRVEPAEVEVVLAGHDDVLEAAVVVSGGGVPDGAVLAAHVALRAPYADQDLRAYVADRVPPAALPARFVVHDRLPRLDSGKVDRHALTEWRESVSAVAQEASAPLRSEMELLVANVWTEVLKVAMGRSSNFFESGGTSLTAMRAVARVRRATGLRVPVRLLFEAPVLEVYAARLEGLLSGPVA